VATTGTGRAAWNEWTGTTWKLTEVTSTDYVLVHYYAVGDIREPIIGIVGQAEYATANLAREGAETEINALAMGSMASLTPEFKALGTVIWQTSNAYDNAVKSRVVTI
jgi:hypothetical protein